MRFIYRTYNFHNLFDKPKHKFEKHCKKALSYFKNYAMADRNTQFLTEDDEPMRSEPIYLSSDENSTSQCPISNIYLSDKHGDKYDTMNITNVQMQSKSQLRRMTVTYPDPLHP